MADLVLGHMEKEGVEVMRGCVPCSLTCTSASSDITVSFKMLKEDQFQDVSGLWKGGENLSCTQVCYK